jgi:ribosomal protein L24E
MVQQRTCDYGGEDIEPGTGKMCVKKDGTIHEGMLPKMENAFTALSKGVRRVSIKHPANLLTKTGTVLT